MIRLDPKDTDAYNDRCFAHIKNGENDLALPDCNEAIRLDPKDAVAYSNRGIAYRAKGDNDRAIADYNEAIRLDRKAAPPYNNRGNAYKAKGDYDTAISDYTEAIRLDPKYITAYNNRGAAYARDGKFDRAIADYSEVIKIDPKSAAAYFNRGRADLYSGALPKAVADLNAASELDPKDPYWLDIVNKRSSLPSRLPEAAKQIDMTKWPAPIIRLYLGQSIAEAGFQEHEPDDNTEIAHICEGDFFRAELIFQRGDKDKAAALFRAAAVVCPPNYVEHEGAVAELKGLGPTR